MLLGNYAQIGVEGAVVLADSLTRKIVNGFTYRQVSGGSVWATEKAALGTQFISDVWHNHFNSLLSASWVGQHCWVSLPWLAGDVALDTGVPQDGNDGGARLPVVIAGVLNLRTGLRGRTWRGRKYVSPLGADVNNGDELKSFIQTLWGIFASPITSQLTTSTGAVWQPVVWSRKLTGDPLVSPGIGADLVSFDVAPRLATWRHRTQRENPGVIGACCPGDAIPYTLYLYTNHVGCVSIDDISHMKLTWNGSFWQSLPYAGPGLSSPFTFAIGCTGPLWSLGISDVHGAPQWNCTQFGSAVCKPFAVVFRATGRSTTSCFGATSTVTVQTF